MWLLKNSKGVSGDDEWLVTSASVHVSVGEPLNLHRLTATRQCAYATMKATAYRQEREREGGQRWGVIACSRRRIAESWAVFVEAV